MSTSTEGHYLDDVLKRELPGSQHPSRENVTVISGQDLSAFAVVGKILFSTTVTPAYTRAGGTASTGTVASITLGSKAKKGSYSVVCHTTGADATGKFFVYEPDGAYLGEATSGTAFTSNQINFTASEGAGSDPWDAGDEIELPVTTGSEKITEVDFTAVDGSQYAYGFLVSAVDASSADTDGVAVVWEADVVTDNLVWPTGATTTQKTAALAELADRRIRSVEEV
jgi:hypothetical protein